MENLVRGTVFDLSKYSCRDCWNRCDSNRYYRYRYQHPAELQEKVENKYQKSNRLFRRRSGCFFDK